MVQKLTIVRQSAGSERRGSIRVQLTRQADKSLTDIIEQISAALRAHFKIEGSENRHRFWYPREVFDDYVVACEDETNKLFKISYSIDGDQVTFGEPVEVEEEYVEVESANEEMAMQSLSHIRQAVDAEGWRWRFQVLGFGMSKTRDIWEAEIFRQSLPQWEGVACYVDHPTNEELEQRPERSLRDKAGWWENFEVTQSGVDATLTIRPSFGWLRDDIRAAYQAQRYDFIGASIFALAPFEVIRAADGRPARKRTSIEKPLSIDLVTTAAADGHVKYALASPRGRNHPQGETAMLKEFLAALFLTNKVQFELVRQSLAGAGAQGVTETITEDQLAEVVAASEEISRQAIALFRKPSPPATASGEQIDFDRLPESLRLVVIGQALSDSQLPEAVRQNIVKRCGPKASLDDINREIAAAREICAVVTQGSVDNPGRVQVGAESIDKVTIGLAKAFNLTREQFLGVESCVEQSVRQSGRQPFQPAESDWQSAPQIWSIRQLYIDMTGDRELSGVPRRENRLTRQAQNPWATSDFGDLLSNLMHKRLLASYREVDFGLDRVVTPVAISDFKQQQIIVLGYFGDLSTVAENGEYTTFAALSDDKEVFTPAKKGKTVDLNIETIANDDLRGIVRAPNLMGRSARRTLAKAVWNDALFSNPTLNQDSKALFHVDHNNLITDALGTTGLANAITKLLMQTEPGSSEKFSFNTADLTLAIRSDLLLTAISLTDFNQEPGGNVDAIARLIRRSDSRLGITPVAIPFLSDANDWILAANRSEADIVHVGYWMGKQEPEFFMLDGETHEKAFNNDVLNRWKVRFIFGVTPADFRPAVKSVVAG